MCYNKNLMFFSNLDIFSATDLAATLMLIPVSISSNTIVETLSVSAKYSFNS